MLVAELSVGWIDQRVGLGWVGNGSKFCFSGLGRVMGLKWQMFEKYNPSVDFSCVGHTPLLTLGRDCQPRKLNQLNLFVGGCVQA